MSSDESQDSNIVRLRFSRPLSPEARALLLRGILAHSHSIIAEPNTPYSATPSPEIHPSRKIQPALSYDTEDEPVRSAHRPRKRARQGESSPFNISYCAKDLQRRRTTLLTLHTTTVILFLILSSRIQKFQIPTLQPWEQKTKQREPGLGNHVPRYVQLFTTCNCLIVFHPSWHINDTWLTTPT